MSSILQPGVSTLINQLQTHPFFPVHCGPNSEPKHKGPNPFALLPFSVHIYPVALGHMMQVSPGKREVEVPVGLIAS